MKLTTNQIVIAFPYLADLNGVKLPITTSYRLKTLIDALAPHNQHVYQVRDEVGARYGKPLPTGGFRIPPGPSLVAADAELNELLAITVEIPDQELIPVQVLIDRGIELSVDAINALSGWLIDITSLLPAPVPEPAEPQPEPTP